MGQGPLCKCITIRLVYFVQRSLIDYSNIIVDGSKMMESQKANLVLRMRGNVDFLSRSLEYKKTLQMTKQFLHMRM
jgi:hypothetical protein